MNAQVKKPAPAVGKKRKDVTQIPVSFGAFPEEIERWKEAANKVDRPLSWWIRNRLISLDARDAETAAAGKEA